MPATTPQNDPTNAQYLATARYGGRYSNNAVVGVSCECGPVGDTSPAFRCVERNWDCTVCGGPVLIFLHF